VTAQNAILIFCASAIGGVLNAVAGGGSFISFPAILFTGIAPIPANATNSVAVWIGVLASSGAYRKRLDVSSRVMIPLAVSSFVGGGLGAYFLLHTPARTFLRLLPWLMLAATLLFIFGGRLTRSLRISIGKAPSKSALVAATVFAFFVAIYGGYFGGGIGIVTLAMFAALGMNDIHAMNAFKLVLNSLINGIAVLAFVLAGAVLWKQAAIMTAGGVMGGYLGAHYAQKLPAPLVRGLVITVGVSVTTYYFWKSYHG
jgi:uncharacterized membrane protein YfcA